MLVWVGEGVFVLIGPVVAVGKAVGDGGGVSSICVCCSPGVGFASIIKLAPRDGSGFARDADVGVSREVALSNDSSVTADDVVGWQLLIK